MPTGYTAAVQSGRITTLEEFALQCARGMGALIMMRDEPSDAPIPERFEPSDYHTKRLADSKASLLTVTTMSRQDAQEESDAAYNTALKRFDERVAGRTEEAKRYEAMIEKVENWETKAEGIKEFMLQQLRDSYDFDCQPINPNDPYIGRPKKNTGEEWRAEEIKKLTRAVAYHSEEEAKEISRTEARNRWLADLRASLPAKATGAPQ